MPNIINEVVVNGNTYGLPGSGTLSNLATIESNASAASKAYAVGDHLVLNDVYYAVTAAIAQNDALLVGTNISVAKAGDEIKQLNNDLTDYSVNTPLRNVTYYNGKLYQITSTGQRGSEIQMGKTPIPDYKNKVNIPSSMSSAPSDGYVTASSVAGKGDMFFVEGFNPVGKGLVPVKRGDAFTYGQYYGTGVGIFYPIRYFE